MPGIKPAITGFGSQVYGAKYLNVLPHLMMKKLLEFFLVKNKGFLFFLYNMSFCVGLSFRISKSCWRDENKVLIQKTKLDSIFSSNVEEFCFEK